MTVTITPLAIDRPIGRANVNGKSVDVYPTREYAAAFNALLTRTGGATTNLISQIADVAAQAQVTAQVTAAAAVEANNSGAPPGYVLSPSNPLSYVDVSSIAATVNIAAHTRTPTGMSAISVNAGSVQIQRGVPYSIYYVDPTDAGGAVTYLATEDPSVATDYAAGARIVGSAFRSLPRQVYGRGGGEETYIP